MAKRDPKTPQPTLETTASAQDQGKERDNRDAMSVVSTGQKNKSWAKSLKKATNSILYMAMPPNSAEQLPMVVAQTPMSPDRLPSVPSIALLPGGPLYSDFSSPTSTFTPTLTATAAPTSSGYTLPPPVPAPPTQSIFVPASTSTSTLSVASSTAASSSSSKAVSKEARSRRSTSSSTSGQAKSSSTTSSTHSNVRPSVKGKERSESAPVKDMVPTNYKELTEISVVSRSVTRSPPASPPPSKTNGTSTMPTTLKAALGSQEQDDLTETFPSPPPSPQNAVENEGVRRPSEPELVLEHIENRNAKTILQEATSTSLPFPILSSFDISLETAIIEPESKKEEPTQEEGPKEHPVLTIDTRISSPSIASDSQSTQTFTTADTSIPPTSPISPSSPTSPVSPTSPSMASEKKQKRHSMVVDVSGFPAIPAKSMSLALSRSRASALGLPRPRPVQNAPWIWHQDGFHHQRLESHQILTKEQVFEQFHLDLEQDGPNGFFLFKLVKKFKRQDSSLLGISSSLLDAEISASPTSTSPAGSPMTPTSILDSIDAVSVSQRLKRQLLLQRRKKQRKTSSTSESEEDDNLEALLTMSNNNTSLQNLNSSLQEVIDAVDSLRETSDWTGLLDQPNEYSHTKYQEQKVFKRQEVKQHTPDSDNEYTSKDKDAMDVDALEHRKGVYATGRLDGMNLISKKRFKALARKSSTSTSRKNTSNNSSNANSSESTTVQDEASSKKGSSSSITEPVDLAFKKQAIMQLHIYSRNGLKFKFDVMQDNELHFVEASKKYTFMDPLAAHRQPDLDVGSSKVGDDALSPLPVRSHTSVPIPALPSSANKVAWRSNSARSKNTVSSVGSSSTPASGNRRVFVTRLGRHTLLTYTEYKVLAKSASSFTLGAKLLIQRSLAVATGSSGSSSSKDNTNNSNHNNNDNNSGLVIGSPTRASFASPTSPLTATPSQASSETSEYFSAKKKSRSIPGFASKAVAAIKTPSTPGTPTSSGSKTPRPIVTPYNPAEYKNNALRVSGNTASSGTPDESSSNTTPSPYTPLSEHGARPSSSPSDIPRSDLSSTHHEYSNLASSPQATNYLSSSPPALPPTPGTSSSSSNTSSSTSSSSNPYTSAIKRQGNQAGLKFQHLFATVHQRLQKLELDNGVSFYTSSLVQWTVIEDPAELRWWRDKIGIQMIGRLPGDALPVSMTRNSVATFATHATHGTGAVRQSYMSMSTISDASSMGPARPFKSTVSVERLGYRFLRVSGHMGTLKVTVSEQVEARAVALAVRAELLKQHSQQPKVAYPPVGGPSVSLADQAWIEIDEEAEEESGDDDDEAEEKFADSDDDEDEEEVLRGKTFYDVYEYDEWTGRTRMKKTPSADRFSRRKRHDRAYAQQQQKKDDGAKRATTTEKQPLIERMTMIVGQAKVFKGDWYMKNVYRYDMK